jgi:hypothetical protein
MQSTVTNYFFSRLLSINNQKTNIMRTLSNNQLTGTLQSTKSYTWNSKRRYRV